MQKPHLVWVDMTITTRHSEVDARFSEYFDIQYGSVLNDCEVDASQLHGKALAFEFDYPDRPGLSVLRNTKQRYPSIPILMLTAQHSEQLAVWAFRNHVLDYLTIPVARQDMVRCRRLLQAIQSTEQNAGERTMLDSESRIPDVVPVTQRMRYAKLAPALHFVQKNFRHKVRIADVAEQCSVSAFHFSHEFTETYSLSFQAFVLRYRIFEACKELRHPNVPVANVAYSVGFNDPSYFARVFKRIIGVTPSDFCVQIMEVGHKERLKEVLDRLELPALEATRDFDRAAEQNQALYERRHASRTGKY
ncbi:MAG: AraC family transcriptional regulator [Burkholderiales bacterium]|nr:AraC family transcriptional regulator [Burkholderiales bacterium]